MEPSTLPPVNSRAQQLPKLAYIGDVPVESSYLGSLLLYRLLQDYPMANLRIVEGKLLRLSAPERRLTGVQYQTFSLGHERLLRTRFHKFYSAILSLTAARRAKQIESLLRNFSPKAVLTVTHGYSWMTAAVFAARHQLPLHLICHDDWPRIADLPDAVKNWLDSVFGRVYRQAASRFCVSPAMRDTYRARYGVAGEVLYPSRSPDCTSYDAPPQRLTSKSSRFTIAFAGTINSESYANALVVLAHALDEINGRLLIFGPISREEAKRHGLVRENIELHGLRPSADLLEQFRKLVDALFVPMSFDERERANMESSFPSKLADYTAVGLPILIRGPEYCSAVSWARENPDVADVVTSKNREPLAKAVRRLSEDSSYRMTLAVRALEVGQRYFAAEALQRILYRSLRE